MGHENTFMSLCRPMNHGFQGALARDLARYGHSWTMSISFRSMDHVAKPGAIVHGVLVIWRDTRVPFSIQPGALGRQIPMDHEITTGMSLCRSMDHGLTESSCHVARYPSSVLNSARRHDAIVPWVVS